MKPQLGLEVRRESMVKMEVRVKELIRLGYV
jgi:hypothetical protein